MQENFSDLFPSLSENSRVWIYLSDKRFNESQSTEIERDIRQFVSSWTSHSQEVKADGGLLFSQCIVLSAEEDANQVSGCSIDSSVHFIKSIGQKYKVDFFNRLNMLILTKDGIKTVSYHELGKYENDQLFNPRIDRLKELRQTWLVPIKDSDFI